MSSFAYGRLTREREQFSPARERDYVDVLTAPDRGVPSDQLKDMVAKLTREPGAGRVDRGGNPPAKPAVGSYVDAMVAIVPAEALAFHAAATSFSGVIATTTSGEGNAAVQSSSVADVDGAVWLIVLSMACTVALFIAGKFGSTWTGMDVVRMFIPPGAFLIWLVLQEQSIYWMLWDRSSELPNWTFLDNVAWNAYIVKISAVFLAVVLPLLAGALGVKAERDDPPKKRKYRRVRREEGEREAVGGDGRGGAPQATQAPEAARA